MLGSSGSMASLATVMANSSLDPFRVTLTMAPPAVPSARRAFWASCILACICCACFMRKRMSMENSYSALSWWDLPRRMGGSFTGGMWMSMLRRRRVMYSMT